MKKLLFVFACLLIANFNAQSQSFCFTPSHAPNSDEYAAFLTTANVKSSYF